MKVSDLKLAVKCCITSSDKWEDSCGGCPLNKGAKSFEEMTEITNCVDTLINALAEYLPEDEDEIDELLKVLDICGNDEPCNICPYRGKFTDDGELINETACMDKLFINTKNIIIDLQTENANLKTEIEKLQKMGESRGK